MVNSKKNAREIKIPYPGDDIITKIGALGFHGQRSPAELGEVCERAGGTATAFFFWKNKVS